MGEAKRKQILQEERQAATAPSDYFRGVIDLHMLPQVSGLTLERLRALTGHEVLPAEMEPDDVVPILMAFRAVVGDRKFHVGFCIGDGERFSPTGIGVIERLMIEVPGAKLHVVSIVHEDVAWDIVQRHLRTFNKDVLLLAFANSDAYDAGSSGKFYTSSIRNFGPDGGLLPQLTTEQRRQIRLQKAEILDRLPPPVLHTAAGVEQEDSPWIFRVITAEGKEMRTAVWNGRHNYEHEFPEDIIR